MTLIKDLGKVNIFVPQDLKDIDTDHEKFVPYMKSLYTYASLKRSKPTVQAILRKMPGSTYA